MKYVHYSALSRLPNKSAFLPIGIPENEQKQNDLRTATISTKYVRCIHEINGKPDKYS